MARAYRCAAQPSTRVWLDCYYGAAQPVRSALGMPPAPPAQARLSEAPAAPGEPADAVMRGQVMAEAARCTAVMEDRRWLDCFYAASNPVRAGLGLRAIGGGPDPTRATPPLPVTPPPTRLATQYRSGFMSGMFGTGDIQARGRMASYAFDTGGRFTVTLDNGEVWRQVAGDSAVAHWRKPPTAYLVTISGGFFGSHDLIVRGSSGKFKVRRVS